MESWENDTPVPAIVKPIRKWDDEDVEKDDIKHNWEESSEEENEKSATTPTAPPKKTTAQKLADAKRSNNYGNDEEDELERKKRERQAVREADLENTRGMFQGVSIKEVGSPKIISNNAKGMPTREIKYTLDSINPKTKDQFDEFSKLLVDRIRKHEKQGMYNNFINDFIRELCLPLRDAEVRKVASTLTNLASDKQKEKDKDKPKKKGKAKPALQVERVDSVDITNYDDFDDFHEFDDYDDFM